MTFTWVDWGIAAIICVSCLISLQRGFVKEALSLLIWIVAGAVAWKFGDALSGYLVDFIEIPSVRVMAARGILFITTLLLGGLVNYLICQLVRFTGLSGTDRFLGMAFGAARGSLLVVFLVGLVNLTPVQEDSWWKQSALIPQFLLVADWSKERILQLPGGWSSVSGLHSG